MAIPAGVTTATITVGVPVTFSGTPLGSIINVTPSAFVVHTATGTPLVNLIEQTVTEPGVAAQVTLPHTDQNGFQDENGNAYKNWYYTATIQYTGSGTVQAPKTKIFQLTSGQTTVDLDMIPGGAPVLPYTAPAATVSSVNGQTGAVVLPALIPDPVNTGTGAGFYILSGV